MSEPIRYDIGTTSLGPVLVAVSTAGVCAVSLADDETALRADLARSCTDAVRDEAALASTLPAVITRIDQSQLAPLTRLDSPSPALAPTIHLDFRGTDFQRRVWSALLEIAWGHSTTYAALTERLGLPPTSIRAVGQAVARNPIAVLVPCHRVIRSDGALAGYRWGLERKHTLLERERAADTKGRGHGLQGSLFAPR
jgi:AraC family transcriptional regulator of adaptative response/methylated-DNA-[protein]-cysteine methyltransferase